MVLVFLGPPGSGKGTQTDRLESSGAFIKISTGDMLRKHIADRTPVGLKVQEIMARGELVSDDVLFEIVQEELRMAGKKTVLFDGFPRTLNQANSLKKLGKEFPVLAALHLDVAEGELIDRLGGRRTCPQCASVYHHRNKKPRVSGKCDACGSDLVTRPDDEPEKIQVRMQVYAKQTAPIIDYYQAKGLYFRIDGGRHPDVVYADLKKLVDTIVCQARKDDR